MRQVERLSTNTPELAPVPIEFYSCLQVWEKEFCQTRQTFESEEYTRVVYLGQYFDNDPYPDLFACYGKDLFHLWSGKLNDGVY